LATKTQPLAQPEPAPAITQVAPEPALEPIQAKPAPAPTTTKSKPAPAPAATKSKPASTDKSKASKSSPLGFIIFLVIGVVVLGGLLYVFGIWPRVVASGQLDQEQKLSTERRVVFVPARLATPKSELPLPGTIEAYQQASIFARTTGYVKRWLVDIGDQVKEGDLLAELDTPEVDQQLSQAQSTAEQAKAAVDIAQTAADRWDTMVKAKAVSQEEADEKDSTLKQAKATYDADMANVRQLTDTENFKQIRAPFAGTITFRHIEVGNLVTAGSGNGPNNASSELFRIAQIDPLRIYVDVPEGRAPAIQTGVVADVHVQAYPDRVFKGTVVRNAGALDNASRTLRTEIQVPNKDGALLPGAYADVHLELVDKTPAILIPANTLIVNSAGTQVAMLEDQNDKDHYKVHLLPVKVGRDFGTEVEILNNVKEGDRLVTNPAADLSEGTIVTGKALPVPAPPAPPATTPLKS
jgi:RND family efflux transporter MFP subunit